MKLIKLDLNQIKELNAKGVQVVGDYKSFRVMHEGKEFRFLPDELYKAIEFAENGPEIIEQVEEVEEIEEVQEAEPVEEIEPVEEDQEAEPVEEVEEVKEEKKKRKPKKVNKDA